MLVNVLNVQDREYINSKFADLKTFINSKFDDNEKEHKLIFTGVGKNTRFRLILTGMAITVSFAGFVLAAVKLWSIVIKWLV